VGSVGTVVKAPDPGSNWWTIRWPNGSSNVYRYGNGDYDIVPASQSGTGTSPTPTPAPAPAPSPAPAPAPAPVHPPAPPGPYLVTKPARSTAVRDMLDRCLGEAGGAAGVLRKLKEGGYDNIFALKSWVSTEEDLQALGIEAVVARRRILKAIQEMPLPPFPPTTLTLEE
jgi:hypothetical protein